MERITSRTNETVKAVVRLRERAERARRRLFFCEGVHLAEEFLRQGRPVERVFATDAALESHGALLAGFGDRVTLVTPEVYGKLSEEKAPQGILLVAPWPENVSGRKPSAKRRRILLDGVRDPGNVGTVIRTAAALGIGRVVLSRDCADVLACKTVRASMGAVLCRHRQRGAGRAPGRRRGLHRLPAHTADRPGRKPQRRRGRRDFYVGDEKSG